MSGDHYGKMGSSYLSAELAEKLRVQSPRPSPIQNTFYRPSEIKNTHVVFEQGTSHALPERMRNYGAGNLDPLVAHNPSYTTAGFWRTPEVHVGDQLAVQHPYSMDAGVLHKLETLGLVPSVSRDSSFATVRTGHGLARCASIPVCIPEQPRVIESNYSTLSDHMRILQQPPGWIVTEIEKCIVDPHCLFHHTKAILHYYKHTLNVHIIRKLIGLRVLCPFLSVLCPFLIVICPCKDKKTQ